MKPAIPIAGAFLVGLAGGAFAAKGPPAPVETTVVKKDATTADTTRAKSDTSATPGAGVAPDSAAAHSDSQGLVVEGTGPVAAPVAKTKSEDDAQQVANSFAKLTAAEIVPIATHMSDEDLLPVLRKLDVGTSAAVLALMPKSRSSGLSKKLLVPATMAAKP
jgi:type IV secretory pathway VirJ component